MTVDQYIAQHIDAEPEYLYRLWRDTNVRLLRGRMASGHLQGRLLKMLVQLFQPKRVLEVGTFSGYSALCLAEGLEGDGHLWTFEINDEQEDFTRPWIEGSPWADRIEMIIGDVTELLPQLVERVRGEQGKQIFDLVFMDANKRDYCTYYDLVFPYLRSGGWLIADNTLWDGHVIDPSYAKDAQTRGILAFNDLMRHEAETGRIDLNILPIRDGLTIIRKN